MAPHRPAGFARVVDLLYTRATGYHLPHHLPRHLLHNQNSVAGAEIYRIS